MFTKEAQELAEATIKAIKKIAEKAGKECSECKGKAHGLKTLSGVGIYPYTCETCNGKGKVKGKWEWKPEVGDWFEFRWKDIQKLIIIPVKFYLEEDNICFDDYVFPISHCIPLLHWERIEGILEGMGYRLWVEKHVDSAFTCTIAVKTNEIYERRVCRTEAKIRQEAVMRAVIELGKEQANEKD